MAGPDGNLWFTEGGNNIVRVTPSGVITPFALPVTGESSLGIAVGSDGNMWFTEPGANKIGRITTAGAITEFTIPTASSNPRYIAAGSDGNLWFTENGASKIGQVTPAGVFAEFALPASTSPVGIASGPDGNVWFADGDHSIGLITPGGSISEFPNSCPGRFGCGQITSGPDGNLWFTGDGSIVGRVTTAGVTTGLFLSPTSGVMQGIASGPDGNMWFADASNGSSSDFIDSMSPAAPDLPAVGGLSPGSGTALGGDTILVKGIQLNGATAVDFGSVPAASFTVQFSSSIGYYISAVTPQYLSGGTVDITVATPLGTSATQPTDRFTFLTNPPVLASISTNQGPAAGGTPVTINGTDLLGATAVDFGSIPAASFTVVSTNQINAVSPAAPPGTATITVTTPFGTTVTTSNAAQFQFLADFSHGVQLPVGARPFGITNGPDGALWFTEAGRNRIGRATPSGILQEFSTGITPSSGPALTVGHPIDITSGPDGNLWFLWGDGAGCSDPGYIARITPGGVVTPFPLPHGCPAGIATGPDGNLWVTESNWFASQADIRAIDRVTPGGVVTEFALPTSQSAPAGIVTGPNGKLWFTEFNGNAIGQIATRGRVTQSALAAPGSQPDGIATGPDKRVWFTDLGTSTIGAQSVHGGKATLYSLPAGSAPQGITVGSDGNLWFTENIGGVSGAAMLGQITTTGTITQFPLTTSNPSSPLPPGTHTITTGSDGALWFVEPGTDSIGRM